MIMLKRSNPHSHYKQNTCQPLMLRAPSFRWHLNRVELESIFPAPTSVLTFVSQSLPWFRHRSFFFTGNPYRFLSTSVLRDFSSVSLDSVSIMSSASSARTGGSSSASTTENESDDVKTLRSNRILSSKLYFDVQSSKVPVIYSPSYDIAFLGIEKLHPFDSSKWGRICRFLAMDGVLDKKHIVEPLEATNDDLLVVHSKKYLNGLRSSTKVSIIIEVPPIALMPSCLVQRKVLYPFCKQVGGTILSAKLAKERGWAINVGGGFHHCSAENGGGFCVYADISLCIHFAFVRLNISRVMIIDLDAHQGNGHEKDFSNDSRVYILDMYNPDIYPFDHEAKRWIDQRVEVPSGTSTVDYLSQLDKLLQVASLNFNPELIVYNAGTDILEGDPLGRLKISPEGIAARDEKVFRFAHKRSIPLVMLTSGGYMKSSARVIADSIRNLSEKSLINLQNPPGKI